MCAKIARLIFGMGEQFYVCLHNTRTAMPAVTDSNHPILP